MIREQIRLRENALSQLELLTEYKRLFVHHNSHRHSAALAGDEKRGLFSIFVSMMTIPLSKTGVARTSEDHLTIELVLHLFRNLLCAGDCHMNGSYGDKAVRDSTALHLEMIQLLDRELVLDILLIIGQEIDNRENKQYNLLVMEILHHLLKIQVRCRINDENMEERALLFVFIQIPKLNINVVLFKDPVLVARSPLSRSLEWKENKQIIKSSGLKSKLEVERHRSLSVTSSRHSHFGGTLALKKTSGKVHYLQASVDTLFNVQCGLSASAITKVAEERRKSKKHQVFIGSGRAQAVHSRSGVSITSVMQDMGPSNHRANQVLHKFCKNFIDQCYGPVMKSLKNDFRRDSSRLEDGDLHIFFRIIWFFCQWWRVVQKDSSVDGIGPLIVTMDIFMFKRLVRASENYLELKKFSELARAVALYSEMMHLLHFMFRAADTTEQIMALGLMDQLFYHPEPMDILPKLLSRWLPGTFYREYVCDLLELSHVTLKLLDLNAELCAPYLVRKSSKQKRLNKKSEDSSAEPQDTVSHMKAIASEFDVKSYFTRKLVSNQIVFMYGHLLSFYEINADHVNKHIVEFFVRLRKVEISSYDCVNDIGNISQNVANLEPMLFNIPILMVINQILCDKNLRKPENEFLLTFATGLIRHFDICTQKNPMLFVETLFRHPLPLRFCEASFNLYVTDEMRMIAERDALLERRKHEKDMTITTIEDRPLANVVDNDDDGEIEFDQRFSDSFEARGDYYMSRNGVKIGKKNKDAKARRAAVSQRDSVVNVNRDDSSIQSSDKVEGVDNDVEGNSASPHKRVAVDEEDEERLTPVDKVVVRKQQKRMKRIASNNDSDDDDGMLVDNDRVLIKPNWADDDE